MAQILTLQPFPFCGTTTGRYVKGNSSEMMRLYYRVKRYSISGSFTNYQFGDPDFPQSASYSGTNDSNAATELDLVCGAGTTSNISASGSIFLASFNLEWSASDFYFNSRPSQAVKLYGNITFDTDQDDTSGITTLVDGSLSPFTIDGFQVYEGERPVNYHPTAFLTSPLIDNFSASIVAQEFWPYAP